MSFAFIEFSVKMATGEQDKFFKKVLKSDIDKNVEKFGSIPLDSGFLIAVIADEDTCAAFALAGVGERLTKQDLPYLMNLYIFDKDVEALKKAFKFFLNHKLIAVVAIQTHCANAIREDLNKNQKVFPIVIEFPSRHLEFNVKNDPVIQRALVSDSRKFLFFPKIRKPLLVKRKPSEKPTKSL